MNGTGINLLSCGGMRVTTFSDDELINVPLLYIYDKKEMENVSNDFIRHLLER